MNIQEVFTPISWDHLLKKGDKPKKDQLGEKIKELEDKIDKLNKNISVLEKKNDKSVPSLRKEVTLLRSSLKTELSKHPIGRQIQEVEAKIEEIDSRRSKRRVMKLVAEVKTMDRHHRGGERVAKESHLAARDLNEREEKEGLEAKLRELKLAFVDCGTYDRVEELIQKLKSELTGKESSTDAVELDIPLLGRCSFKLGKDAKGEALLYQTSGKSYEILMGEEEDKNIALTVVTPHRKYQDITAITLEKKVKDIHEEKEHKPKKKEKTVDDVNKENIVFRHIKNEDL